MAVSMITPMWIQEIMHSYSEDSFVQELMTLLSVDTHGPSLWHNVNGVLRRKGKVYVGSQGPLRQQLISNFHDTPLGGHSGQLGTLKRLTQYFYWPKMRTMVNDIVTKTTMQHIRVYFNLCRFRIKLGVMLAWIL